MIRCRSNISALGFNSVWLMGCLICIWAFNSSLKAQTNDTIVHALHEVEITSVKSKQINTTKKTLVIDSVTKQNFNQTNLADLLAATSPIFIKNYGPANLSTAAFRGGNASQSPVLWNGFNIQNPMLGQNDFSQLPTFLFDKVGIEYGGSAATWGSGAMGGSIHLNNASGFNKGFHTLITMGLGSFDTKKLNTLVHYSTQKFSTTTKVYYNHSLNDFNYKDTLVKQQRHADYTIKGFLQEISLLFMKNEKLNIRAWYNQSSRNLPPVLGNKISKANQDDRNIKLTAEWLHEGLKFTPSVRAAYFDDVLNYSDSISSIYSNSRTKTLITEADAKYKFNSYNGIYFGYNFTDYKAYTKNYNDSLHELSKQALVAGYNLNLLNNRLNYDLQVRQEFSKAFQIPFTGSTGISYQLCSLLKLKVNAAKVYRLPTLNDLYWSNGGNPNLKPEDGYTYEGGLDFKFNYKNLLITSEMTYFSKTISNWISWVPGPGGNPTAINLTEVFSRGTETTNHITYTYKDLKCKLGFNSAYVLSNPVKSGLDNDAAINKQLIYTPRYNYGANFTFNYQSFMLAYYYNYIGYRFTSSDNSTWLKPYDVSNMRVAYKFNLSHLGILSAFSLNNMFNTSYMVIAQRPMPLRNYEISLTLTYHKPKNKNTTI